MEENTGTGQTLTVARTTFEIIELLQDHGELGVTELGDELDMPKSTAHAYLKTMSKCGYVTKSDGNYRLSFKLLEHGGLLRNRVEIYQAAKSEIDELARGTGEVANLAVEERGQRVILYGAEGENAIWDNSPVGDHSYMHWTAMGKAMLSRFSRSRVEGIIDRHGLPEATENTITDPESLFEELEEIRERGYSIESEEHRNSISAIGAPIESAEKGLIGAIAVVGPTHRFSDPDRIEELSERVLESVNVISLRYTHY